MTINVRQTAPTQSISANTAGQVLQFAATGQVLITTTGDLCLVATGTSGAVSAANGVPVLANVQSLIQTGQQYNQAPGDVYVAITSTGNTEVYVTPVSAA
jgi:hypothetical protein